MKKQTQGINPVVSGVAGAVVGAGLGAAAGAAMNDSKTRKKVEKVVNSVKKQAADYIESMDPKKSIEEGKKAVSNMAMKAAKGREDIARKVESRSSGKKSAKK